MTPMICFTCPNCQKALKAPDNCSGRKTSCPKCGQRLYVPPPGGTQNKSILGQSMPDPAGSSQEPTSRQASGHDPFECPACHTTLYIAKQWIGHMVACPNCQTTFAALSASPLIDSIDD